MIPPQDKEVLWVFDLIREEEAYRLQALLPSIDIVTKEQVVGLGRETTVFKQAEKVVVLSMYITWMSRSKQNMVDQE